MKKKFLSVLLAICMALPCLFALNACGEKDDSLDYLAFTLLEDDTYSVSLKDNYRVWTDIGDNMPQGGEDRWELNDKTIKIPSTYEGKAVTRIGYNGFSSGCMTAVEIPSSVTSIAQNAFISAIWLERVEFSEGLKTICSQAFDFMQNLEYVVLPASIEYIGDWAFGLSEPSKKMKVYYKGTAEQMSQIKSVGYSFIDGEDVFSYSDVPFSMSSKYAWYMQAEDLNSITDYISTDQKIGGLWKYNASQEIESVAIEYADTVGGKTFAYTNSTVELSDEYWQMLASAKAQGMLEAVLDPAQVAMYNESANKEEFAAKMATANATALTGTSLVFADGKVTSWQGETQLTVPVDYVEVNNTIYIKVRSTYTLAYAIEGNAVVEMLTTEHSAAKNYYTAQAN